MDAKKYKELVDELARLKGVSANEAARIIIDVVIKFTAWKEQVSR